MSTILKAMKVVTADNNWFSYIFKVNVPKYQVFFLHIYMYFWPRLHLPLSLSLLAMGIFRDAKGSSGTSVLNTLLIDHQIN